MADQRMFPIQSQRGAAPHPLLIPWSVAELAYSVYAGLYGKGQSLARLAERGGFGPGEMDEFLPGWRERCDEITLLRAACQAAYDHLDQYGDVKSHEELMASQDRVFDLLRPHVRSVGRPVSDERMRVLQERLEL